MCSTVLQHRQRPSSSRKADGWHQWLSSARAILFVVSVMVVLNVTSVAAQDLQCPEGQVVLQMDTANWLEEYTAFNVSVTSSPNDDNFSFVQSWPDTPTLEPFCVPADTCLTVNIQVKYLDTDAEFPPFSIIYDTINLNLLGPFLHHGLQNGREKRIDFYGQVGASCEVTCDEDQVLLEIEAVTAEATHYDWQVIDDLTNEVIRACRSPAPPVDSNSTFYNNVLCYWWSESWFRDRVCVPKDGCYHLVAGRSSAPTFEGTFHVTLGGEVLLKTESFLVESVRLQHSESPSHCSSNTSLCRTAADSSLVEMEIFTFSIPFGGENTTLTWNVDYYDSDELISKQGIVVSGDRPLQYNRVCIPDCAIFSYISYDEDRFFPSIQVRVDGIIEQGDWFPFWVAGQGSFVGSSCQSSRYCAQSFVQVGIRYHPPLPLSNEDRFGTWYIVDADGVGKGEKSYGYSTVYDEWIPSFQPGKHYRRNVCLSDQYFQEGSNGGCTILDMRLENEQSLETYSYDVSVNGVFFSDRIDCSKETTLGYLFLCKWLDYVTKDSRYIVLTPLNDNCKMKHIRVYLAAGTVIAAVLGGLLGARLSYCLFKKRRRRGAAGRISNDDASESAASHGALLGQEEQHGSNPLPVAGIE